MNVELTIQLMFDEYPTLFKERADCLNHLFCTIGNGYVWQNGELIEIGGSYKNVNEKQLYQHLIKRKAFQHNKMTLRDEAICYFEQQIPSETLKNLSKEQKKIIAEYKKQLVEKESNDYYKEPNRYKRWSFYQNGNIDFNQDFAYLFNFPENIKYDWKNAILECRKLLAEDGYVLPK